MTPLHVALVPLGSHGDVHPFVGLGIELRRRGHGVTVITSGYFEPLCRQAGLDFFAHSSAEDYHQLAANPDLWHPRKSFLALVNAVMQPVEATFNELKALQALHGDRLVVAGSTLGLATRVAQEVLSLPTATVHLSPIMFPSVWALPRFPGVPPLERLPRWVRRLFLHAMNRAVDRMLGPSLNAYRAQFHLPPARRLFADWWHSPQLVLAMFPDWFGPPQPDWPPNVHTVGFPLYDESDVTPLPPQLKAFLESGPPPVAFTPGSAMFHGKTFFAASAEACRLAGERGLLLSRHADHIPQALPPGVIHVPFAPFSRLLPRCRAIVHHGGIGTTSQALAAGIPQIIHPFAHDQPDNAHRLGRLGVARTIRPRHYKPPRVAATLRSLLGSPEVRRRCEAVAERMQHQHALTRAADLLETLARKAP